MSIVTLYNVFIRDFRKQKKRITLTLIALGWGTVSIMLMLAFGEGLHRQLLMQKRGLGDGIGILSRQNGFARCAQEFTVFRSYTQLD